MRGEPPAPPDRRRAPPAGPALNPRPYHHRHRHRHHFRYLLRHFDRWDRKRPLVLSRHDQHGLAPPVAAALPNARTPLPRSTSGPPESTGTRPDIAAAVARALPPDPAPPLPSLPRVPLFRDRGAAASERFPPQAAPQRPEERRPLRRPRRSNGGQPQPRPVASETAHTQA